MDWRRGTERLVIPNHHVEELRLGQVDANVVLAWVVGNRGAGHIHPIDIGH
jgi:hypothetical protein